MTVIFLPSYVHFYNSTNTLYIFFISFFVYILYDLYGPASTTVTDHKRVSFAGIIVHSVCGLVNL